MQREAYTAYDKKGRRKYLTRREGKAFAKHARNLSESDALFCLTIFYTGIRISEALTLTGASIDAETDCIRVRCLKKRTLDEFRRIPVPEFLSKSLKSAANGEADARLWPFSRTTGWRLVKRVMERATIDGIHATVKGLRHAFGVRGAMAGVPLNVIQGWMGHANPSTTAIYLDVRDEEERLLIRRTWK